MSGPLLLLLLLLMPFLAAAQDDDTRWAQPKYKAVAEQLYAMGRDDQKYREQVDSVTQKFGYKSGELASLWKKMKNADSVNNVKLKTILRKYGWLGPKEVGNEANDVIFMVIQHSDLETQHKYAPLMRQAVQNNNGSASNLAYLEDRIATREDRMQLYGTQLRCLGDKCELQLLADPDNVDKRRRQVGLGPLADYLKDYDLVWDVAAYKKEHPETVGKTQK